MFCATYYESWDVSILINLWYSISRNFHTQSIHSCIKQTNNQLASWSWMFIATYCVSLSLICKQTTGQQDNTIMNNVNLTGCCLHVVDAFACMALYFTDHTASSSNRTMVTLWQERFVYAATCPHIRHRERVCDKGQQFWTIIIGRS